MRSLAFALLLLFGTSSIARADLFSPGPLSKPHADLEGLSRCTACHPAGGKLSADRCLQCHEELKGQIASGQGFHGRIPNAERACERCHPEHQGRDFALVPWTPSKKGFDHTKTGWPLAGKHASAECSRCHTPKRVAAPEVRALLQKTPSRETYLGLATRCAGCHFDEHRGQLGSDCDRCHSETSFEPATKLDHGKTAFPLEGKHALVGCVQCHPREQDTATPQDAFPGPRKPSFSRFKGIAHASCTDCHEDSHAGRFGASCVDCHSTAGWKQIRSLAKERGFHEKTRFPLRGAHAAAACSACHGKPARYTGVAFGQCSDCHVDAHLGQIAGPAPGKSQDCEKCHTLTSFKPPKLELEHHASTRYPLEGSHRAVPCARCHAQDPKMAERIPAATRATLRRQHRPERFSLARFTLSFERCESCHTDRHAGQFADPRGCAACHDTSAFSKIRFDHIKDSRFPLTGKHASIACESCHRTEIIAGKKAVRYKPLETACSACHPDPHLAQFALQGRTACERCHDTAGFKPARFEHRPPATEFSLEGKHAQVACEKCHPAVPVAPDVTARRYKPLPRDCQDCHDDFHRGAFRGRALLGTAKGARAAYLSNETQCAGCHTVAGWSGVAMAHEQTGFPLRGAHEHAACNACHAEGFGSALPTRCAGCHKDVHNQERGLRCEGCHDEESWSSHFGADAHRRTNFPLTGRHAFLPCTECHLDLADRGFSRATLSCMGCHERDYQRTALTSINHAAAGFSAECQQCHEPFRFAPSRFAAHDRCFELQGGPHGGIRCLSCHTRLTGATVTGACFTNTASCTSCHTHACNRTDSRHRNVAGYQCKDRKCYECHRFASGG